LFTQIYSGAFFRQGASRQLEDLTVTDVWDDIGLVVCEMAGTAASVIAKKTSTKMFHADELFKFMASTLRFSKPEQQTTPDSVRWCTWFVLLLHVAFNDVMISEFFYV
jgi:hypothetical protein